MPCTQDAPLHFTESDDKKTKFINHPRARRTDVEPIIRKVNSLVIIGSFLFQYTMRACPAQRGKKKTAAGQVDFVRLLCIFGRF